MRRAPRALPLKVRPQHTGGATVRVSAEVARLVAFRVRALGRAVRDEVQARPVSALLIAPAAAAALWLAIGVSTTREGAFDLGAGMVLLLVFFHAARRDARFLALAGLPARAVFAAEYLLAALPVAALLVGGPAPAAGLAVLAAAAAVGVLPAGMAAGVRARVAGRRPARVPAPRHAFEWRVGVRGNAVVIAVVYALGLLLPVPAGVLLVLMAFLTWTCSTFYAPQEGWPLVQAPALPPAAFLRMKMRHALAGWAAVVSPLAAALLLRQPERWALLAGASGGLAVVLAGTVLGKYAAYRPVGGMRPAAGFQPFILAGALLLPPVAALLLLRLWRNAVRTLQPYLHAFHP